MLLLVALRVEVSAYSLRALYSKTFECYNKPLLVHVLYEKKNPMKKKAAVYFLARWGFEIQHPLGANKKISNQVFCERMLCVHTMVVQSFALHYIDFFSLLRSSDYSAS